MVRINDLRGKYLDFPLDSILILCKLLNKDKSYIYTYGEEEVSKTVELDFVKLMEKRKSGYPIQYILGEKEFMGLDFYLEKGVLIPRPDTEVLVEYIIEYVKNNYHNIDVKILDIGIGSGAISLSLAYYIRNAFIYGVDISSTAIKVANINKEKFNLRNVSFHKGDLFRAIEDLNLKNGFNVIVSNPPYIPKEEINNLQVEVKDHEPRLALDGGIDGLDFYRRITVDSKEFLAPKGLLIYEIGYDQGESVMNILKQEGFKDIQILKDLQGHDRVVMGINN